MSAAGRKLTNLKVYALLLITLNLLSTELILAQVSGKL